MLHRNRDETKQNKSQSLHLQTKKISKKLNINMSKQVLCSSNENNKSSNSNSFKTTQCYSNITIYFK